MAAGGTGGHIFPLLVVAERLRAAGAAEVEFVGAGRPLETRIIPAAGFPLRAVRVAGLKGMRGWRMLHNLMLLPVGALDMATVLNRIKPRVVVGVGGYVAGPALLEAALAGIPTLLIEPNALPGFTNRVLAPVVRRAAVGFESAARFYGGKSQLTGHPVRPEFFQVPPMPPAPPLPLTLLIVGGSLGARGINRLIVECLNKIEPQSSGWRIIHQTGERDYPDVEAAYRKRGTRAEVHAFIDDMPRALASAHLVISRAGASAIAEFAAAGRPSLLIPFPAATDQHQLMNAREAERAGAARVLEEKAATPERLLQEVRDLLDNPARLSQMGRRARTFAHPEAAEKIAQIILELGNS
jgi:UDP-N-acetylglucosamine--N-acetylmuramyl-(pentapeptide) pyrophosphoryl-undecaprenol N-acetylglucosamine transferase